jgi:hypothetical protein
VSIPQASVVIEQFRKLVVDRLGFLVGLGFHRAPNFEETSATGCTVIYLGKNVGFVFSLDLRDWVVDAQVVKVRDGHMKRLWEGGYSSNLFMHLVKHTGFRGSRTEPAGRPRSEFDLAAIERMIDRWADLLTRHGQTLTRDQSDSLPN